MEINRDMKLNLIYIFCLIWGSSLVSCGEKKVEISVSNETDIELGPRTVEISAPEILHKLDSKGFYITDFNGKEVPSQLTHDSLILFKCQLPPNSSEIYTVHRSDSIHCYPASVWGQIYPERRDDLSYENELVGFRIYGPCTQKAGEKAYGYDIFFKYPTEELIIPQLYASQTDETLWAKVDSLRKIDNNLAEEFINSFTYHVDHGKGMDCYAVGPSLGAGVAAILDNDSICYPWCYDVVEILDNGPIRFSALLKFKTEDKGSLKSLTEYRIITLDSYSYLNSCKVWFEGLEKSADMVIGFPLRYDSSPIIMPEKGILAYADPTQGPDNGKALLGIKKNNPSDTSFIKENHILLSYKLKPGDTLDYKWGFSWSKTEIPTLEKWVEYLETADLNYTITLK